MRNRAAVLSLLLLVCLAAAFAADHNDPNAVNSIFADVPVSAADLYDMFGWPSDDRAGGEKVVLALTFASIPRAGVFDTDLLYRVLIVPDTREPSPVGNASLDDVIAHAARLKRKTLSVKPSEVRVTVSADASGAQQARVDFIDFPGGTFHKVVPMNRVLTIDTPDGHGVKTFIGGRDDAFFNDLPGFFRSINYAPQFYHVPLSMKGMRELQIPKTLLELEGNTLFNYDPSRPRHGSGVKYDLPAGPYKLTPARYKKDANGNYRFVYSGKDAQAGMNVNAIILELPMAFLTKTPEKHRIINAWGESWMLKASEAAQRIEDTRIGFWARVRNFFRRLFGKSQAPQFTTELTKYKHIDTDGVAFADAGLSEREDERQLADNLVLARQFVRRFAHLGWGFAPSVSALGLGTCFDHDNSPVSVHRTYRTASAAFPRVKKCFFQSLNMPDDSWNTSGKPIPLRRPYEIFIPNVNAVDMDTNGSWPFGRRLEDQVATRFLSAFLDHAAGCGGKPCNVETLGTQALWDSAPIEPKTPPNPLKNDKPFLTQFPYLAEPW